MKNTFEGEVEKGQLQRFLKITITEGNREKVLDALEEAHTGEIIDLLAAALVGNEVISRDNLDPQVIKTAARKLIENQQEKTLEDALISACAKRINAKPSGKGPGYAVVDREGIVMTTARNKEDVPQALRKAGAPEQEK